MTQRNEANIEGFGLARIKKEGYYFFYDDPEAQAKLDKLANTACKSRILTQPFALTRKKSYES